MAKFVKSDDGERWYAIDDTGRVVAYIQKNRFGTHGHWRGWMHYKYCYYANRLLRCDVSCTSVFPSWGVGGGFGWAKDAWTDEPLVFSNVKDFKAHYAA